MEGKEAPDEEGTGGAVTWEQLEEEQDGGISTLGAEMQREQEEEDKEQREGMGDTQGHLRKMHRGGRRRGGGRGYELHWEADTPGASPGSHCTLRVRLSLKRSMW